MSLEYQENLLKEINKDLNITHSNMKDATEGVIKQGRQITGIQGHLDDAGKSIQKTDNTMFIIEWREKCYRLSLYGLILIEFITIIVIILYKLLR
jgi:hypothetical protein